MASRKISRMAVCALLALFCAIPSVAQEPGLEQFSGTWRGIGTYQKQNGISGCDSVEMVFRGSDQALDFVSGGRSCGSFNEKFQPIHLERLGDSLLFQGAPVGKVLGNRLEVSFVFGNGSAATTYSMAMSRSGEILHYFESLQSAAEETPQISFSGILSR